MANVNLNPYAFWRVLIKKLSLRHLKDISSPELRHCSQTYKTESLYPDLMVLWPSVDPLTSPCLSSLICKTGTIIVVKMTGWHNKFSRVFAAQLNGLKKQRYLSRIEVFKVIKRIWNWIDHVTVNKNYPKFRKKGPGESHVPFQCHRKILF